MVGWLTKRFSECPQCGSPNVRVPWSLAGREAARRRTWALLALWISYGAWAAAAALTGSLWLWIAPAAVYATATLAALQRAGAERRRRRCLDCGHVWNAEAASAGRQR